MSPKVVPIPSRCSVPICRSWRSDPVVSPLQIRSSVVLPTPARRCVVGSDDDDRPRDSTFRPPTGRAFALAPIVTNGGSCHECRRTMPRGIRRERDAGASNDSARSQGRARRQVAVDAGWRVRTGGDPSRARGETRCAVDQAGDRHRVVEGAAGRSQASAATARYRIETRARPGYARCGGGPVAHQAHRVETAIARGDQGASSRAALGGVQASACGTGSIHGTPPLGGTAVGRGEKSGTHQGCTWPVRSGEESRADACATLARVPVRHPR
jgi:hypothetical protein